MEHEIKIEDGIFIVTASGSADLRGFSAFLQELANNDDWTSGSRLMVDFRKLENFNPDNMDFSKLSSIASFIKKNSERFMNMKVVTLLIDEMDGMVVTGLWESLQSYYGSEFKHEIFTNYNGAINWLNSN
ncbi:hypothetical protein ACFLZI_02545 [Nitrospirota bacterium]